MSEQEPTLPVENSAEAKNEKFFEKAKVFKTLGLEHIPKFLELYSNQLTETEKQKAMEDMQLTIDAMDRLESLWRIAQNRQVGLEKKPE